MKYEVKYKDPKGKNGTTTVTAGSVHEAKAKAGGFLPPGSTVVEVKLAGDVREING